MDEPLKDGVKQDSETPAENIPQDVKLEEVKVETPEEVSFKPPTPPKGYVPTEALQEEREHIKILEEELRKVKESSVSSEQLAQLPDYDLMTDSEKWMAKELIQLKEKSKWEDDITRAKKSFPVLGDKEAEFKEYCYKFPKSVDVEVLAKSFLFDSVKPEPEVAKEPSKGLEKPTGGSRQVPPSGPTLDEITRLRVNQPKLYAQMIQEGKLKKIPEK